MKDLETLAEIKASQHVMLMQLALIRHELNPARPLEDYISEILMNQTDEKNRIFNELIRSQN